jgi:hypothetical protein
VSGLLILLICGRLRRITARFAALAARYAAGTLRPLRPRATEPRTEPPIPGLHRPPPRDKLPRGYAWLIRLVPGAANFGTQLQYLLSQPEMAEMIAAVPQMSRLLRRTSPASPGCSGSECGCRSRYDQNPPEWPPKGMPI